MLSSWPEVLNGYWMHLAKLDNHSSISYCGSLYKNDKYKSGTIIVSNYILNDYPDVYATLDKNNELNRVYTNPALRPSHVWEWWGVITKFLLKNNLNSDFHAPKIRNKTAQDGYVRYQKNINSPDKYRLEELTLLPNIEEPPRDFMYPTIWYNKRIKEVLKNENS